VTDTTTGHLALSDRRQLAFHDFGSGENGIWIHCHGIPGSRAELSHLEANLVGAGIRVVIPDRPGYGESSPVEGYNFLTHSQDLVALADHLGIERFSVSGFSGGGVFALSAAANLGHRIEQLTLAGTPAAPLLENPLEHVSELTASAWQAAENSPAPLAIMLESLTESHQQLAEAMLNATDEQDRDYLKAGHILPGIKRNMKAAVAQGASVSASAMARDTFLITEQWPVTLRSPGTSTRLIHGARDALIHCTHLRALKAWMPGARTEIIRDIGHYSSLPLIWHLQSMDVSIL